MDHDHGDLARFVGTDQEQVGPLEGLFGTEQAGPAVAIEIGPRPHVGQRRRQVDLECEDVGLVTDGRALCTGSYSQSVHSRASLMSTLGVVQPRVGNEECRQRKCHLRRIESFLRRALAFLASAVSRTAIKGTPSPY